MNLPHSGLLLQLAVYSVARGTLRLPRAVSTIVVFLRTFYDAVGVTNNVHVTNK